jgi:hypothetical protein
MAKAINPHGISGNIGDQNFYKHPLYGWIVRKKRRPNATAIATDPKYQKFREQKLRLAKASVYGKILRHSFSPVLTSVADRKFHNRLTAVFVEAITHSENDSTKLSRHFHLLNGMELNEGANKIYFDILSSSYTKAKGIGVEMRVQLKRINHTDPVFCRVFGAVRRIDIENNLCEKEQITGSKITPIEPGNMITFSLHFDQSMRGGNLFFVLTVRFYECVNRKMYQLNDSGLTGRRLYWLG